jgi:hypothetical protein
MELGYRPYRAFVLEKSLRRALPYANAYALSGQTIMSCYSLSCQDEIHFIITIQ